MVLEVREGLLVLDDMCNLDMNVDTVNTRKTVLLVNEESGSDRSLTGLSIKDRLRGIDLWLEEGSEAPVPLDSRRLTLGLACLDRQNL